MRLAELVADWAGNKAAAELVLHHLGEVGSHDDGSILASEKLGKAAAEPAELARKFERVAGADAEVRGGRQRYRLTATKRGGQPIDSHAWLLDGGEAELTGDNRAQLKIMAKQNQKLHELMVRNAESTTDRLAKLLDDLGGRFNNLQTIVQDQFVQQVSLTAQLYDRTIDQRLEQQQWEASEGRKERLLTHAENVIPQILAHTSGSTVLRDLWEELGPEKRKMFSDALTDDQVRIIYGALELDQAAKEGAAEMLGLVHRARVMTDGNGAPIKGTVVKGGADEASE